MKSALLTRIALIIIVVTAWSFYFTYLMPLIILPAWGSGSILMVFNALLLIIGIALVLLPELYREHKKRPLQSTNELMALLYRRERHLKAVLDGTYDGIITIDEKGIIEDFNLGAVKIFDYQPEEIIGQKIETLLPANERSDHRRAVSDANLKGTKVIHRPRELYGLKKDGSLVPVEVTLNKVVNDNHINYVGVVRDVSALAVERNNLVAALIEAESAGEAKNRLLSAASHELRTPLNAILGFSELLIAEQQKASAQQLNHIKDIYHSAELLLLLVNDVLDYAKLESKQLHFNIEAIELSAVIKETLKMSQHDLQRMKINYQLNCPDGIYINADYYRFQQVLLNLVSNACKYNSLGGSVDIVVRQLEKNSCTLDIIDTGIGIDDDKINDLFVPFSRLHDLRNTIEGTGIGLAICKHLVDAMAGEIRYEENPAGGSIFSLSMPRSEVVINSVSIERDGSFGSDFEQSEHIKVLYVEDNVVNIRLMEAVLKRLNVSMVAVLSAEEGFDYLHSHSVDIIFMDINLPGMSGIEAASKIASMPSLAEVPVIAVSASLTEVKAISANACFFDAIAKPFKIDRIRRVIVQTMAQLLV